MPQPASPTRAVVGIWNHAPLRCAEDNPGKMLALLADGPRRDKVEQGRGGLISLPAPCEFPQVFGGAGPLTAGGTGSGRQAVHDNRPLWNTREGDRIWFRHSPTRLPPC